MNSLNIEFVQGKNPPQIEATRVVCIKVVITEQATQAGLPVVDFVMSDPLGKIIKLTLTGRIITTLAAAIQGVNVRNHGNPDP